MAENTDFSSDITLDSIVQNARSLMPKVLLDWVDNIEPVNMAKLTSGLETAATIATAGITGSNFALPKMLGASSRPLSERILPVEGGRPDAGTPATAVGSSETQVDPVAMMTQQLGQEAARLTAMADAKAVNATRTAGAVNTALQVRKPATPPLDAAYTDLIAGDTQVVGRFSPGTRMVAKSDNMRVTTDPNTGEIVLHAPKPGVMDATRVQQNDTKIASQIVHAASTNAPGQLDIDKEMTKIQRLSGEARAAAMGQLLVSIDLQLSKEFQRIREQAAIEGGYREAQASLQKNLELDIQSGFTARFNQASAQTIRAQSSLGAALAAAQNLEQSLIKADPEIAKLLGRKHVLMKIDAKRELRESRREELRDTVTAQELTNYHFAYGSSGNDDQDKDTIVARRDKEPGLKKLLQASPDNIYGLLTDPSLDVRSKAAKLVSAYDASANGLPQGTDSRTLALIRPYISDPLKIINDAPIPTKDKSRLEVQLRAATGKELEQLKATTLSNLLQTIIQTKVMNTFRDNVRGWRSDLITPGSPLGQVIDEVSKTNPTGAAPMQTVVETFVSKSFKGPDGKDITTDMKIAMMVQALKGSVNNEQKTMLLGDFDYIPMRLGNDIKNTAQRYELGNFIKNVLISPVIGPALQIFK